MPPPTRSCLCFSKSTKRRPGGLNLEPMRRVTVLCWLAPFGQGQGHSTLRGQELARISSETVRAFPASTTATRCHRARHFRPGGRLLHKPPVIGLPTFCGASLPTEPHLYRNRDIPHASTNVSRGSNLQ